MLQGGAKSIGPLVAQCPLLEDFRFSTTRVPEAGGVVLGEALGNCTRLKRLNLSDNTYNMGGATALAASLAKMPEMEWLNLCDTGLTEDGAVLVMRATAGMAGWAHAFSPSWVVFTQMPRGVRGVFSRWAASSSRRRCCVSG